MSQENDDLKEIEELNKDIENNLKLNSEVDSILNDNTKREWSYCEDITYHFKQNIERAWIILQSFDLLSLINNKGHYPCIIIKGTNTWDVGNIFEGKFYGTFPFRAKVLKRSSFPEYKYIQWLICGYSKELFKMKIRLYKVTEDNSTVLVSRMKFTSPKIKDCIFSKINHAKENDFELFQQIEKMLEDEPIDLFQYESGIINGKMEDIWDIMTDVSKLDKIAPDNHCFAPLNIKNLKVGDIIKLPISVEGKEDFLDIKIDVIEDKKGWNRWVAAYSILDSAPIKIPKQTVFVQLTKINQTDTQLSIFTKIHEAISSDCFQELTKRKKYVIHSVKDYFENFFSPGTPNNKEKRGSK